MPNPTVAILVHAADARALVAAGAREWSVIRYHGSVEEVLATLADTEVALLVIDGADPAGRSMAPAVAMIHREFPSVPILAYYNPLPGSSATMVELASAGVTGIALRGIDDTAVAMRAAVRSARLSSLGRKIYGELAPHLPRAVLPLLHYAISRAADEPGVDDASACLGVDRKTLYNWMSRCGKVRPRELINRVRVAIAVGMLEDRGRTAEQVALELGFASAPAFRNMLSRYTGRTSTEIRADGGLAGVLGDLIADLTAPMPEPESEPKSVEQDELRDRRLRTNA